MRKGVANDPQRKDKIARAALDLLAEGGLRAVTHRTIASRAGVPLGSVTYYYATLDDVFVAAFELMQQEIDARFDLPAAPTQAVARAQIVDSICGSSRASAREVVLYREMYAYGSRSERVAELVRRFEQRWIASLTTHFPEPAARALDALMEGWTIHQSWNPGRLDADMVARAVDALADAYTAEADTAQRAKAAAERPTTTGANHR
jgi:TetR/AcrR family transcriptional regulator, regulator of biofilm formation and stress response